MDKLDLPELLKGTKYEPYTATIVRIVVREKLDTEYLLGDIRRLGRLTPEPTNDGLYAVLVERIAAGNEPVVAPEPEIEQDYKASRAARRLAEKKGVDLGLVKGTGRGGLIIKSDVEDYLNKE